MTVHLVKMAVGIESLDHLREVQAERFRRTAETEGEGVLRHMTRNTPRRSEEVLDGGSIYWILKGYNRAPIRDHQTAVGLHLYLAENDEKSGRQVCVDLPGL